MKGSAIDISGRECRLYKDSNAEFLLVQPIDEHDLEALDQEVEIIKELSDKPFSLAAFMIKDWNQELTSAGSDLSPRSSVGFSSAQLGRICNPTALNIRIFNPTFSSFRIANANIRNGWITNPAELRAANYGHYANFF